MQILIVKLSAIGDVIHTLPALCALRRHYPRARITWLVEESAADLLKGHRALDRRIVSGRKRWLQGLTVAGRHRTVAEMGSFLKQLRDTRYDLILDFQALLKGAAAVLLARGRRKIGFGPGMEHMEGSWFVLNERVPAVSMEIHAIERNLMMLAPLGIHTRRVVYDLPSGPREQQQARELVAGTGPGPLIAVNPMAKWESKQWPPEHFARLAARLCERFGARICFTGSSDDRPPVARIRRRIAGQTLDLTGRTGLRTLAALYRRCDLVISTDTGPMHLAAAVGTPVVALFGPTAPWRTGPYGRRHRVVRARLPCSPCFERRCMRADDCMRAIRVDAVLSAAAEVLEAGGRCSLPDG